jgi:cytidylate kinase
VGVTDERKISIAELSGKMADFLESNEDVILEAFLASFLQYEGQTDAVTVLARARSFVRATRSERISDELRGVANRVGTRDSRQ